MPVVDTEVLFALSPKDPKHSKVIRLLDSLRNVRSSDVAVLEFQLVLRGRQRGVAEVRGALFALNKALADHGVEETHTLNTSLLALQSEIEVQHNLSYFDSLIAASALAVDSHVISNDPAFDRVPGLKRIAIA